MNGQGFYCEEEKPWQSKRQNKCSFGSVYLNCLVLFWDWPPSGSTYRSLWDLAYSCPIQHLTLQYLLSMGTADLLQVGMPVVYPVNNRWECSSPTMLFSPCNTWKPRLSWCWISKPFFSVFQDQLVAFWKWNCLKTVVVEISFVRQLVAQLESPVVNQMINWDDLGNEAVNPKLFVVLWSF